MKVIEWSLMPFFLSFPIQFATVLSKHIAFEWIELH